MIRAVTVSLLVMTSVQVSAREAMSFVPGETARLAVETARPANASIRRLPPRSIRRTRTSMANGTKQARANPASPGGGFKMEDGVLTYPAPARFQPKAVLKRR